jgi:hypothetical protein
LRREEIYSIARKGGEEGKAINTATKSRFDRVVAAIDNKQLAHR